MSVIKIVSLFLSTLILYSCSTPGQNIILPTAKNEIPAKFKEIIQKTGQLTDEDINVTVYKTVVQTVVAINTTSFSNSIFSTQPVEGTGSGFFISNDGYIMTNYHVVSNTSKLEITLADKSKWLAQLIGGNKEKDIAVIKINVPSRQFAVTPFGDSNNISVGQKVLVIGSPFGLTGTLTTGIISSVKRTLTAEDGTILNDIIQTDAAINPGNSGGPLINSSGEIIGINTALFSPNGGNVGIGLAVSINSIKDALKDIESKFK